MHPIMSKTATTNNQEMNKKRFYNKPKWLANLKIASAPLPGAGKVTWNPLDKGSVVTLSNNNLTASYTNYTGSNVRANIGRTSGKWYFEITINNANGASAINIGVLPGNENIETTYYYGRGYIQYRVYPTPVGATYGVTVDCGALNSQYGVTTWFPCVGDDNSTGACTHTANFKGPFRYPIPAGYAAYEI